MTPDHIDRATEALWGATCTDGIRAAWRGDCRAMAEALDAAGLLASPEHDAAVAARALRDAQSDIRARIQHMAHHGASGEYLAALNDAWSLLNNRVRDIEREGDAS